MDLDRVFSPRPANLVPASTYLLPATDRGLPADVQEWLRCHPLSYDLGGHDGKFARCGVCEEWTRGRGCEVRRLAEAGDIEAAHALHEAREWPAGSGKATTAFKGMKPNYRLVTFKYVDPPGEETGP